MNNGIKPALVPKLDAMDEMKKPVPVRIVEAIAWMYVVLSVLLFICMIVNVSSSDVLFALLYGLCLMSLPVGMLLSLFPLR